MDAQIQTNIDDVVNDNSVDAIHDEDGALGILGTLGRGAVTKEENRESDVPTNNQQNPPIQMLKTQI